MASKSVSAHVPKSGGSTQKTTAQHQHQAPGFSTIGAFTIFCFSNLLAAAFSPIQDCDEVFNYWEPSHYLNHGFGMQTWEYSPDYAIRSWLYAGLHAIVAFPVRFVAVGGKQAEFYFVRVVLALVCAGCETKLHSTIAKTLNPRVAVFFLMVMVFSPGIFHSSTAYLPSSFAMYTTMLGMDSFMNWKGGLRTAQGIFWFAVGGIIGWPFATALVIPYLVEELMLAYFAQQGGELALRVMYGTTRSLLVLALEVAVDSLFYRKLVCVPLNIVWYNVFSAFSSGSKAQIYGVEPWHFYIRNLILNFNIWFFLAVAAAPLVLMHHFLTKSAVHTQSILRSLTFISPFYLWLTIFTLQPHKEERFMYPAYPALALNAAMSFHVLLSHFGSTDPRSLFSIIPAKLKLVIVSTFVLGTINLGVLRSIGMATGYSAPLRVLAPLQLQLGVIRPSDTVCMGKEWYRFPSSYFLPNQARAKFVRSEFKGLLPGEFSEANTGFGLFPGAWLTPSGMNDENIEDPGKYTDIKHCTFIVDSYFPRSGTTALEPAYILDTMNWQRVACELFLDQARTGTIARLIWIPPLRGLPASLQRRWGQFCLLRRRADGGSQTNRS